jgi:hypothetical protein
VRDSGGGDGGVRESGYREARKVSSDQWGGNDGGVLGKDDVEKRRRLVRALAEEERRQGRRLRRVRWRGTKSTLRTCVCLR